MAKKTWIKVGGIWKEVKAIWMKVGGVWEKWIISWRKVGGVWEQCIIAPKIVADPANLWLDWTALDYSDYTDVDVYPEDMATTITEIDTGDGTNWAEAFPDDGNGDFSFRARSLSENNTGSPRSMILRISDDGSEANDFDVMLHQEMAPI